MTLEDFRQSLTAPQPPAGLMLALAGLWWDGKGDWKRAHESAQQDEGAEGSRVHAYLHRKGGDQGNAAYWYGRAGNPVCRDSLDGMGQHRQGGAELKRSFSLHNSAGSELVGCDRIREHPKEFGDELLV
jgi:hypothetical protein